MAVDRLSVTVPERLGRELRALAKARGANVSSIVTQAIEREVRLAALDSALSEADDRFGAVSEELIERAQDQLGKAKKRSSVRRRTGP